MADSNSLRRGSSDSDDGNPQIDSRSDEQLSERIVSIQQQLMTMGLIGGDIPEEPVARFNHFDRLARLYTARFLADRSCLEEALSYSDQAKALIPPQAGNTLFLEPDDEGFGDRYVFLRVYAWHKEKSPQNARRLVDAIEWKFDVAPESRTPQEIALLGLSKARVYQETRNPEDLAGAMEKCQEFLDALQDLLESVTDPQELAEHQELYPSVLSCLSQLLYHEFRSSGNYGLLELSIKMGNNVFMEVSDAERPDLGMSFLLDSIAYSFNHKMWEISRSEQPVLDWGYIDEEEGPSTVSEIPTLQLNEANSLYSEFPLTPDNNQIRLLQLKAGVGDDPVTCFLEAVDVEECPDYDVSNMHGNVACTFQKLIKSCTGAIICVG